MSYSEWLELYLMYVNMSYYNDIVADILAKNRAANLRKNYPVYWDILNQKGGNKNA